MSLGGVKPLLQGAVSLLNQHKETIKNVVGAMTFAFGVVELGRPVTTDDLTGYPQWVQSAHKVINVCAKISLILSACTTRPGVFIISSLMGSVFSTTQLDRVFGPNITFVGNPWHPRHVVSITAALLALPSVAQTIYKVIHLGYQSLQSIDLMTLFNSATSRPFLHVGNAAARFTLRSFV